MNREAFFADIRKSLFRSGLKQSQVDGINAILLRAERDGFSAEWAAYVLATVRHETGGTFVPVREIGRGKGRRYGKAAGPWKLIYYGRGWPQLTWWSNYRKQGAKLNIDLERNPDAMLIVSVSAAVTFGGMKDGDFTGKSLADYIKPGGKVDFVGARRIINGTDRAYRIAEYADKFLAALIASGWGRSAPAPDPVPKANPDAAKDKGAIGGAGAGGAVSGGGTVDPSASEWLLWGGAALAALCVIYLVWRNREWLKARIAIAMEGNGNG